MKHPIKSGLLTVAGMMMLAGMLVLVSCAQQSDTNFSHKLEQAMEEARQKEQAELVLFDFEDFDLKTIQTERAEVSLVGEIGGRRLHVECKPTTKSAAIEIMADAPWDLNPYTAVSADITNTHDGPIQLILQVGDPEDGFERWQMQEVIDLAPGESRTLVNSIAVTPWRFNSEARMVGMFGPPGMAKSDLSQIPLIRFATRFATENVSFEVDNIRATGTMAWVDSSGFFPFVDEFGQYAHKDWPGKIHSVEDLKKTGEAEETDLRQNPEPENWDLYGGWEAGPQLEATGYFRTAKIDGLWWLVDPEGRIFWSNGINCVSPGFGTTGVGGREEYFAVLPDKKGPYGEFYGRRRGGSRNFYKEFGAHDTYGFGASNLYKKYGEDWEKEFNRVAHARMRSWGMNSLANAASREMQMDGKTPYTAMVWVRGTEKIEASSGYQGPFHDVFHPGFRENIKRAIERQKAPIDDPWCIGYFVENELSWGRDRSLSIATLESGPDQVAKQVFRDDLKAKYGRIEKLNEAWGSEYISWEEFLENRSEVDEDKALEDLDAFYLKIAETYFSTVHEELTKVAPNHLYLGCRLAWANSDMVVRTAAKYCDVISKNKYEYQVANISLPEGVDLPVMIGEYHFGALDRGLFHVGIKSAANQADRGEKFQAYMESALNHHLIVGAHWFQYKDQVVTGRGDGENYNVGLVSIGDTPFPEMVDAMRATAARLYQSRLETAK